MKTSKSADNEMLTWFCVNKEQILKQVLVFISLRTDKGSADGLIMLLSGQDGDECEAKMKGSWTELSKKNGFHKIAS